MRSDFNELPGIPEEESKFWVVWCPERGLPKVRHYSLEECNAEAERVAERNPGNAPVYVLEAVSVVQRLPNPLQWTKL